MIDVHSHIIPNVDDGCGSIDASLNILKEEISQGVTEVICTPHLRKPVFSVSDTKIKEKFEELKSAALNSGLEIKLHLGREIYCDNTTKKMISSGDFLPLGGSKYVLLEFPFHRNYDIDEFCYEIGLLGVIPVVAHIERYYYFHNLDEIAQLKSLGTLIQVNAPSIAGRAPLKEKIFTSKLLKNNLVDLVGSDIHFSRINYMKKAYEKVKAKDKIYAEKIFYENAKSILYNT